MNSNLNLANSKISSIRLTPKIGNTWTTTKNANARLKTKDEITMNQSISQERFPNLR